MFTASISKDKTLVKQKNTKLVFWWKFFSLFIFAIFVFVLIFSYNIFINIDKDPFIKDGDDITKNLKQYNSEKLVKIKTYFDQKKSLFDNAIVNRPNIPDPSN